MQLHGRNCLLIRLLRFRWVVCQLEVLRQCLAPSVRRILDELPETLDETYERILHEIPKSNRVHAHRLLQCLTVAVRPLYVEELAEVLAVEFETTGGIPPLNEDLRWEDQEQAVLSACSSLIAIVDDDANRVVQFAHFSVKEFLTSDRLATSKIDASRYHHVSLGRAHTIMAQACLSVLLGLHSHIDEAAIDTFPLTRYAAANFGDHAEFEDVLSHLQGGIDDLLDADKPHLAAWLRVRRLMYGYPNEPYSTPLYHVAEFGFRSMVHRLILKRPEDLGVSGTLGMPLHAALCGRHADVAELLLGHCVDVDVRGYKNMTPLHMALRSGLPEVTRMLIECHADINARDSNGMTPLHQVPNGLFFDTPEDSDVDVARILLEHGAHVDAQADNHRTPLHEASYWGSTEVVRLLLEHGANLHVRSENGHTPLHRVFENIQDITWDCCFDVIQFLLERGADVNTLDNNHSTPLHMISSQEGSVKAAELLLKHRANIHIRNNEGKTPVEVASMKGHEALTRLLSEHLQGERRM
jgi:ankyrin repeat protein